MTMPIEPMKCSSVQPNLTLACCAACSTALVIGGGRGGFQLQAIVEMLAASLSDCFLGLETRMQGGTNFPFSARRAAKEVDCHLFPPATHLSNKCLCTAAN